MDYVKPLEIARSFVAKALVKSMVRAIYPSGRNMQYGYVEFVYHWSLNHGATR